jgi:thiol:disulfide interchange protein DsbD
LSGSWWALLGWFYLGGLALSFTPCVLPMIPILSSIIAGQGSVSTSRGFLLSLSYVLGMAVTYTAAGALAALAGGQIQAIFQKPWIITLFAAMFAGLALGMFGLFELQMPTAIQTRLANLANRQRGGTFIGTAIIGALTALIVTTCVAPPLVGALAVIGQSGDVTRGAGALFALSIGMGSPLLLVGASAGQLLPRVGPWMNTVKAAFGVLMLGIAIWMMERVLPGTVILVLWALLVFLTGVFLGAFEPVPANPSPVRRLAKGIGVLACLYGALMLIGATLGGEDPLRPIPQAALSGGGEGGAVAARPTLEFQEIQTIAALEGA